MLQPANEILHFPGARFRARIRQGRVARQSLHYITPFERYVREEAFDEGRNEGRQEEAANIIVRLARKRFNVLTAEDEAVIRRLPLPSLEVLSEALLEFDSVHDLYQWLASQPRPNQ